MDIKLNNNGLDTLFSKGRSIRFLLKGKKSFVFSFLAFFLAILIFSFGLYYLNQGSYTKDLEFKNSRIVFLNGEVSYFKNVYVKNSFSYATYNSFNYLLENKTLILRMNNNYSELNKILSEMIINGSVNGVSNNNLNKSSINYLVSSFQKDFYTNYRGNFSYVVYAMNIYEKNPYYVNLQVYGGYNITTQDNLSSWVFNDTFVVSIPIFEFRDPEFTLNSDKNYSIRYVDLYGSNINWTFESFNESLVNVYSALYLEPEHNYMVGTSFLNRLINVSESSYKNVIGFWSFDYDLDKKMIYDTSRYNLLGKYYGNTKLLLDFDDEIAIDKSVYNNVVSVYGNVNCSMVGVYSSGCSFDGNGDYINVSLNRSIFNSSFSISFWFKTNFSGIGPYRLIRHNDNLGFDLFIVNNSLSIIENENISSMLSSNFSLNNEWNNVILVFSNDTKSLYLNGLLIGNNSRIMAIPNRDYLIIGSHNGISEFFNGSIDEVAFYSKVLSEEEIPIIYKNKKAQFIDYKDSLYGNGIEFDGKDDYLEINQSIFNLVNSNFSIDMWFKPTINNDNSSILNIPRGGGDGNLFIVTINSSDKQIIVQTYHGGASEVISSINNTNLILNSYNYLSITYDGTFRNIYLNSKLINSTNIAVPLSTSNDNLILGADKDSSSDYNQFFSGLIDEVKIYNRTLSDEEIRQNYYNFNSIGKGCCNYITLINPNLMGYNNSFYSANISYNSKLFFNYYNKNIYNNITLWNVSNITTMDINKEYYNFMLDDCMMQTYNIFSFDYDPKIVNFGLYNDSCSNYVREGIY